MFEIIRWILSSRIGIADCTVSYTATLLYRKPWYSCEYNELIKKDSLNLYGNIFREALYAQDIRGLKQYELTDHLGNVLATVSDKRAAGETTGLLTGADSILTFRPVLASTYDYYPFGSLMPGRYMEDTNSYCFTTTETKYVVVPFLEIATPTSGPSALISPGAGTPPTVTDVPGGGIDIDFDPVDAGTMASVSFASGIDAPANTQVETNIEVSVLDAVFNISVIDDSTGNVLASRQVASMQGNTNLLKIIIPNPAASTRIRVKLDQPGQNINRIRINVVRSTSYITTTVNVVSTVCNKAQYPFGFNGQMKVDEVAGKGNHNTALYWEYDTRIGRRANQDPVPKPNMSNYSVLSNSPIWRNDPLGNTDNTYEVTNGVPKKIDDKGGDQVDHVIVKTPETKTPFGTLPANTSTYDVPVQTSMFGTGVGQYTAYRGPGEKIIGSVTDGPIKSFCYECMFIPLPKGLQLFGRGTGITGRVAKSTLEMGATGGGSGTINFYTRLAMDAGYSTALNGSKVEAGAFVQASNNAFRFFSGKPAIRIFSNSEATVVGRSMQNQAIGLGIFNIGTSVGVGIYDFYQADQQSKQQWAPFILPQATIDNLDHK